MNNNEKEELTLISYILSLLTQSNTDKKKDNKTDNKFVRLQPVISDQYKDWQIVYKNPEKAREDSGYF